MLTCLQHKEKELAYWKQQAKDLEIKCQAALQNLHSPTADRVGDLGFGVQGAMDCLWAPARICIASAAALRSAAATDHQHVVKAVLRPGHLISLLAVHSTHDVAARCTCIGLQEPCQAKTCLA